MKAGTEGVFRQANPFRATRGIRVRKGAGAHRNSGPPVTSVAAYGNPTIDFSIVSVTLESVPFPPSKESLPFTPSLELTVSAPPSPFNVSAPPLPMTVSLPKPPFSMSLPPPPVSLLFVLDPVRVSALEEPRRFSSSTNVSDPSPVEELVASEAFTAVREAE